MDDGKLTRVSEEQFSKTLELSVDSDSILNDVRLRQLLKQREPMWEHAGISTDLRGRPLKESSLSESTVQPGEKTMLSTGVPEKANESTEAMFIPDGKTTVVSEVQLENWPRRMCLIESG